MSALPRLTRVIRELSGKAEHVLPDRLRLERNALLGGARRWKAGFVAV